jgi:endonuclease/exonuclease/phosphatase family metal-dependent hydrolase
VSQLRVATLNIWHDRGPWPQRLRMIRAEIERLSPAVIGLQEVLRHRGLAPTVETCQAVQIADGLGYAVAYAAASDRGDSGDVLEGNAVLSRMPIREEQNFRLPGEYSGESRSLLFTLIETPDGDLPVFVTHLNWRPQHGSVRLEQAGFIAERVAQLAPVGGRPLPAILLGDFNAEPGSEEIGLLRDRFADAWTCGGDGSPGVTFDPANDYAREADERGRRIDYIFVQRRDQPPQVRTELAFTKPARSDDAVVWPSDHFGLVSDVMLGASAPGVRATATNRELAGDSGS